MTPSSIRVAQSHQVRQIKASLIEAGQTSTPQFRQAITILARGGAVESALRTIWDTAPANSYNALLLMLEHPDTPDDVLSEIVDRNKNDGNTLLKVLTHPNVSDETVQQVESLPALGFAPGKIHPRSRAIHGW